MQSTGAPNTFTVSGWQSVRVRHIYTKYNNNNVHNAELATFRKSLLFLPSSPFFFFHSIGAILVRL